MVTDRQDTCPLHLLTDRIHAIAPIWQKEKGRRTEREREEVKTECVAGRGSAGEYLSSSLIPQRQCGCTRGAITHVQQWRVRLELGGNYFWVVADHRPPATRQGPSSQMQLKGRSARCMQCFQYYPRTGRIDDVFNTMTHLTKYRQHKNYYFTCGFHCGTKCALKKKKKKQRKVTEKCR